MSQLLQAFEELLGPALSDYEPVPPVHCFDENVVDYLFSEFDLSDADPILPCTYRSIRVCRPLIGCHPDPEKRGVLPAGTYRVVGVDVRAGLYVRIAYEPLDKQGTIIILYVAYSGEIVDWRYTKCADRLLAFRAPLN